MTQSLGIGVEPFARAMAIANLLWGAGAIIAGGFADRFGAGRVIALGIALMMAGYYAMYLAQTGDDLVWSGVLIGIGVCRLRIGRHGGRHRPRRFGQPAYGSASC